MDLREKIRFLGFVILITGIAFIALSLSISLDKSILLLITDFNAVGGIGAFLGLMGTMLVIISLIIPEYWMK